ncbi:MAG TPA: FAD-dependent oxidoreductase [Daejeonella sp.]|nr:FAD-dependent oxidoreductase [Daejeonella sp.]
MMKRFFAGITFLFAFHSGFSQTVKTDVVVVGSQASAVAAGIQAARSGVKTLLISESATLSPELTSADLQALEKVRDHFAVKKLKNKVQKDSLFNQAINPEQSAVLIKSITDTVKNLTLMLNAGVEKISKDGKGWELRLKNGRTVKTNVVIDANEGKLQALLKPAPKTQSDNQSEITGDPYASKLFRTSVAGITYGESSGQSSDILPLKSLLPPEVDNFLITPTSSHQNAMAVGQAAGASAAFCAFFKKTTQELNVRVIQGELLGFDAWLVPFADISFNDRHALAIQRIGLTGLLKAKIQGNVMNFDTLATISSEELRLPMKEFYSRSQIWFADHQRESLSVEDAINLIMFTATRGEELRREVEKGWKISLGLNTNYDPKRPINRREFAVLLDTYLQPFNTRVSMNGFLMN